MIRVTVAVIFILSIFLSADLYACDIPEPPSFGSALKDAKHVFVFRLDLAEYKHKEFRGGASVSWVEGRITPVQNLSGNAFAFDRIRFSSNWCGGVNLVVGHYYLIATSSGGKEIELINSDRSIIDINGFYDPRNKKANLRSSLLLPVVNFINGNGRLPENYPPRNIAARTVPQPPPPPAPPVRH